MVRINADEVRIQVEDGEGNVLGPIFDGDGRRRNEHHALVRAHLARRRAHLRSADADLALLDAPRELRPRPRQPLPRQPRVEALPLLFRSNCEFVPFQSLRL